MVTRSIDARLTALVAAVLLAGCAGVDPYARPRDPRPATDPVPAPAGGPPAAEPAALPQPAAPAVPPSAPKPGPAAAHLLGEARLLVAQGELDRAAAQVERALRIERNSPWLYLALAEIRLAQGDPAQAAALGRRARGLSQGDPQVLEAVNALGQPGASGRPR